MARVERRKRSRRHVAEINVVPYIDVMLVLLVIFMITAPLLKTGVDVQLPQGQAEALDTRQQEPLVLTVTSDGSMYLNVGSDPDLALSREVILRLVSSVMRQQPDKRVLVAGDDQVPYGSVVRAMSILQAGGADEVGLIMEPPS